MVQLSVDLDCLVRQDSVRAGREVFRLEADGGLSSTLVFNGRHSCKLLMLNQLDAGLHIFCGQQNCPDANGRPQGPLLMCAPDRQAPCGYRGSVPGCIPSLS